MDLTSMTVTKASINRVMKEKIDCIPVILIELLAEISTTDKTLLHRSDCITLKEQRTQLKEIIKEIKNNKISKEIKLFSFLAQSLDSLNGHMLSQRQIIM